MRRIPAPQPRTPLDRQIGAATAAHPGESGLLLLDENLDAFAARALSARRAGRSLDLMYYIWHEDLTGRLLLGEALAACGVRRAGRRSIPGDPPERPAFWRNADAATEHLAEVATVGEADGLRGIGFIFLPLLHDPS